MTPRNGASAFSTKCPGFVQRSRCVLSVSPVQWIEVAVDDDDDDDGGWCGSGKKSQKLNLESDSNYIKHQT